MFRGESRLSIDQKGRVAIPARFRERLAELCGGHVVITISLLNRCLSVYPFPDWQRIEADLKNLPALDPKAQGIRHLLIGHAAECDVDAQGRILISQSLREFAALDKQVMLVGQGAKFELWDEPSWSQRRETLLEQVGELLSDPSDALRALVL